MSEQELTLQMGTKVYDDYEELQEYSEEPISSSDTQDVQIQDVQVQSTLEQGTELYKDILEFSLPYIGLGLTLLFLLFVIKESIKAYIWSKFFK